jgi:hypothetical protein
MPGLAFPSIYVSFSACSLTNRHAGIISEPFGDRTDSDICAAGGRGPATGNFIRGGHSLAQFPLTI